MVGMDVDANRGGNTTDKFAIWEILAYSHYSNEILANRLSVSLDSVGNILSSPSMLRSLHSLMTNMRLNICLVDSP